MSEQNEDLIIFKDDDAAARLVENYPVTGWVSRKGNFFGNGQQAEHIARYDGATHKKCPTCGDAIPLRSYCYPCDQKKRDAKHRAQYDALPKIDWDGETPLYSLTYDHWFYDENEVGEFLYEHSEDIAITTEDLLLVIGVPVYASVVDIDTSCYSDYLPEDGEVPAEIQEIFDDFNSRLKACKEPLCWTATGAEYAADPNDVWRE